MEYAVLGRTGAEVSRVGFGGAPAGLTDYLGSYSPEDSDQRRRVTRAVERALELGVTYFDTAPGYGGGEGERIFGEALRGCADDIFVATKVAPWGEGSAVAEGTRASVEASLERLGRDRIDLVQLHGDSYGPERVDAVLRPGGTLDALEKLRHEGLVRFIGFTTEDQNPGVYRFIETGRFDVMQICYNLIFQHPAEPTRPFGSLYEAERAGLGIVTMRALTSGVFQKWVRAVNPSDGFDYSGALLQFVLSSPLVDVALVGMRTAGEVERNVAVCEDTAGRIDIAGLHAKYVEPGDR